MPQTPTSIGATSSLTQSQATISDVSPTLHQKPFRLGFLSAFPRLRHGWKNLNFRTKLTILLVAGTAIPVIIVIQGIVAVTKEMFIPQVQTISAKRRNVLYRRLCDLECG